LVVILEERVSGAGRKSDEGQDTEEGGEEVEKHLVS